MRWFRTHIGLGSRLALFALGVQLVLSFGHVHVGKIGAAPQATIALAQQPQPEGGQKPAPHTGAHDFCAICATVSLLASSMLPSGSTVLPPTAGEHRWLSDFGNTRIAFDPFILFQARAPPTVL